ncbi:hypothetical protein BN7_1687 [Wickerhamomyces ciferrii]|uniref:Uncharacterized protein n=1 Tax=Wickerhamomyces ciferrii (strain ATCC 14091 / BCRC 22168 / CBS 111 / JCM 3599 / NBRC 0793 / NRRL Y-1031 F-60-10) TaxID=1206466 RepID=K0KJ23_WICCF|nr:uncharacterized protein BN7_1687 [Wickerhamomyces ciferrii]CCH42142.1 hypothetical protein BN7_1687 [Wickerhamomyces ciferrii]
MQQNIRFDEIVDSAQGFFDLPHELRQIIFSYIRLADTYKTLYNMGIELKELVKDTVVHVTDSESLSPRGDPGSCINSMPEVESYSMENLYYFLQRKTNMMLFPPTIVNKYFIIELFYQNTSYKLRECLSIPLILTTLKRVHHSIIIQTDGCTQVIDVSLMEDLGRSNFETFTYLMNSVGKFTHEIQFPTLTHLNIDSDLVLRPKIDSKLLQKEYERQYYVPCEGRTLEKHSIIEFTYPNLQNLSIQTNKLNKFVNFKFNHNKLRNYSVKCLPESRSYYLKDIDQCVSLERFSLNSDPLNED